MGFRLVNIINKSTKLEVCPQYYNWDVDTNKSIIEVGKQLKITNLEESFFNHHEKVVNIKDTYNTMTVETTRKIWNFEYYFSCKYCNDEMDLMEEDTYGYRNYSCLNDNCQAMYTIMGEQYDEGEWEEGNLVNVNYKPYTINFYELYKQGKVSENDIHDYIDIWHKRKIDDNISLHEFLGLSWEQYATWVNVNKLD